MIHWNYSDVKKLDWTAHWLIKEPLVFSAIKRLKLDWIPKYFDYILDQNFRLYDHVRKYYAEGVIPKPQSDNYIVGLISLPERLRFKERDKANSLYDFLVENNDALSEDFWRIFQVQGTGEANMSSIEKYTGEPFWNKTIEKLITNGKLNRQEILKKTFEPLKNEWIQFRSGWFSRFHEFLVPTITERKSLEDQYLSLLSSVIGPTKSFALKALNLLSVDNLLDSQKFLNQVDHVLTSDKKTVVKTTISILERILNNDSGFKPEIAKKIVQGLLLSDAGIQKKIGDLLGKMPENDSIISAELEQYKECILPSMKNKFSKWISLDNSNNEVTTQDGDFSPIEHIHEKIDPILDAQELVYHITRTLESPSNIADIELIYQSAFLIKDFPVELLKPIRKRAEYWYHLSEGFTFTIGYLANFLLSWMKGFKYDIEYELEYDSFQMPKIFLFQKERLNKYLQMKRDGKDYTPLSVPASKPYFVDINSFVDRIIENQKANQTVDEYDLIQAIARLDLSTEFDGQKLPTINGELKDIIEFMVLKGDYKPNKFPFAWLAAARTISPNEVLKIQTEHSSFYEIIEPASLKWDIQIDNGRYHNDKIIIDQPLLLTEVPTRKSLFESFNVFKKKDEVSVSDKLIYPLQLFNNFDRSFFEYRMGMDIKWMLSTTPNRQNACYANASRWIGSCASYSDVSDIESKYFMEDLCLSSQPLDEMKCLAMCAGLGCSEKTVRTMATEALIITLNQNRVDLDIVGGILDKMVSSNYMRFNRLVAELTTVSGVSKEHSKAIEKIIFHSIKSTSLQAIPRYFKKLLELLLEVSIENGTTSFTIDEQTTLEKYANVSNLKRVIKALRNL